MGAKLDKNSENTKDSVLNLVETLRKKNKFKWFGYHLANLLYFQNPQSTIRKSYQNSFHCCDEMYQADGKITSKYCKNRWCPQCQRIRMGALINAYAPRLEKEKKLYFITLTRPNVKAECLRQEIEEYQNLWRKIAKTRWFADATKGGMIGIKKLECTYHANKVKLEKHIFLICRSEKTFQKQGREESMSSPFFKPCTMCFKIFEARQRFSPLKKP